jgi:hypothetical protein
MLQPLENTSFCRHILILTLEIYLTPNNVMMCIVPYGL